MLLYRWQAGSRRIHAAENERPAPEGHVVAQLTAARQRQQRE
ncbi:hypothetical protein [Amycolatopsis sp. ATCC 39116]|nr:hypothetical protein [Amycolatopsis sp. ATCC 39116]